jgi:hypothetical protein
MQSGHHRSHHPADRRCKEQFESTVSMQRAAEINSPGGIVQS